MNFKLLQLPDEPRFYFGPVCMQRWDKFSKADGFWVVFLVFVQKNGEITKFFDYSIPRFKAVVDDFGNLVPVGKE